jgi:hypothetical protein
MEKQYCIWTVVTSTGDLTEACAVLLVTKNLFKYNTVIPILIQYKKVFLLSGEMILKTE